jgi:hypothetical protein
VPQKVDLLGKVTFPQLVENFVVVLMELEGLLMCSQELVSWVKLIMFTQIVNLRPTVSRPVCPGDRRPSETCDQFSFSLKFPFDSCSFVILYRPFWRVDGSVIYLYNCFFALPEQLLLGRSPAELTAVFYCLIWDSPNLEGRVPLFISPINRVTQLYPRALSSLFVSSYDSQGSGGGILTRLHTG